MKAVAIALVAMTMGLLGQSEPVVSKESISVHTVRRGDMRLGLILGGTITSVESAKAVVSGPSTAARLLKIGQAVDFELEGRRDSNGRLPIMTGHVSRIDSNSLNRVTSMPNAFPFGMAASLAHKCK